MEVVDLKYINKRNKMYGEIKKDHPFLIELLEMKNKLISKSYMSDYIEDEITSKKVDVINTYIDEYIKMIDITLYDNDYISSGNIVDNLNINYANEKVYSGKDYSIYLAGPTPNEEDVPSWRNLALNYLAKNNFEGVIRMPEHSSNSEKTFGIDEWEYASMEKSNMILFWIPEEIDLLPVFKTNVSFGYWIKSFNIVYGRALNSSKTEYLDWLYKKNYSEKPYDDLYQMINHCEKVRGLYR